jgi:Flp pilus assembly protein TadD
MLVTAVVGLLLWTPGPPAQPPTFNAEIAPLAFTHCAPCHHAGGVGPFPLVTYQDWKKHASQIAAVTASRYMPPWPPQPGSFPFKGDRHLTGSQIQTIAAWVKAGTPEGGSPRPPIPVYRDEWQLGRPDVVLRMPQAFHLQASGEDVFRNFIIPSNLLQTRYVRGFELRLNNKRAVHHGNVVLDRTQSLRHRDGEDGEPGFAGMDVTTEAAPNDFDPDSHFLFWKPATVLTREPEDMSWRLDPGTDLILNLHLQPTGKPESITAEIGLYFATAPPKRKPMLLQLEHDGALTIPPGRQDFAVEDHLRLPVPVKLLAIYPHAHYLGKLIEAWATLPDGTRHLLIRIPDWDINWQATYEYETPPVLPAGTVVSMRIRYDNSSANPRNPSTPPVLVRAGNRSRDEMGHVWLQVLPDGPDSGDSVRLDLQEAAMQRRLEKYPDDFLAHYNLGALQQTRGRLPEAQQAYRDALKIDPTSATARNGLASTYLLQDQIPEALAELRTILAHDGSYENARYNLAQALEASGDLAGAQAEYETYLQAKPADLAGQKRAAALYFSQKRYADAARHLRRALDLDPNDAELASNLGAVLAMTGDLPAAIEALETALRLDSNNRMARQNLDRARAQLAAKTR